MKCIDNLVERITDRVAAIIVAELTKQLPAIVESATRGVTDEVLKKLNLDDVVADVLKHLPWPFK